MTSGRDDLPGLPARGRAYFMERTVLTAHEQEVIDDIDRRLTLLDPAYADRFAVSIAPGRRRWWWPFRR